MGLLSLFHRSSKEKTNSLGKVYLTRFDSSDQGTFGKLETRGFSCFTVELPWRDNKRGISCIPRGKYDVVWNYSPSFKRDMYLIKDVPGRSGIRVHSANFAGDEQKGYRKQLYGCIAPGEKVGILDEQKAVLLSRVATKKFEDHMERKPFTLVIQ